jgi:acyl-coenzyme A thioesterase 7
VLHPSDCHANHVAQAGAVLKLMDTAAGVVCVRHCRSNVVTASLEAVDFLQPIHNGELLEVNARPVFNSKRWVKQARVASSSCRALLMAWVCRSMDIEVNVYAQSFANEDKVLVATSIFTFVSLDQRYRPQEVPPLQLDTAAKEARFAQGLKRYRLRQAQRAKDVTKDVTK